jgi:hypothetical protein
MSSLQREKALEASDRLTKISDVVKLAEVRSRFFDQFSATFAQHSKLAVFFVDSNKDINHFIEQEINDRVIVAPPEVAQEEELGEEEFDEELDTSNMKSSYGAASSYSVQPHPSLLMYQQGGSNMEGRDNNDEYDHSYNDRDYDREYDLLDHGDTYTSSRGRPNDGSSSQRHHRRRGDKHRYHH